MHKPDIANSISGSEAHLAPYAAREASSRGRKHKEPEHPYRLIYQRDRERIIHTTAFRRLEYKTQVFVNHEGDHYRTRLTHTIEVAQIARSIARALLLNEDLAESIALAHDVGHTPFGHSGEDTLKDIMKDHGGFDHNLQGLRVVDLLEERYPDFNGLNLTWEVREGIIKHSTSYDNPPLVEEFNTGESPTLETQVVDMADEIAYFSHDLDDGLASGILKEAELEEIALWQKQAEPLKNTKSALSVQQKRYQAIRMIINTLVTDLIDNSKKKLEESNVRSMSDVRKMQGRIINFSETISKMRIELKGYLFENLYQNYRVMRMADKASRFMKKLFFVYLEKPTALPPPHRDKAKNEDVHRVICDYIAGMTDRYALQEYKRFFEPYERV
ncbi:MAG: deoxyguanosinetriphosphate triphosphohydrolase [Candidatus Omnitrophica bacterium]|nr:deoxyguanosinetriphosphate triphosphohydrolase [Candidatus Omnitrophota bacterium]